MTAYFYDAAAEAAVNATTALANSGSLVILTGTQQAVNTAPTGTVLVTLTLAAAAFNAATASSGTVTAAIPATLTATAANTGTAASYVIYESNGTSVVCTGTVGTSGADLILDSVAISSGAQVSITSFTVTLPET